MMKCLYWENDFFVKSENMVLGLQTEMCLIA